MRRIISRSCKASALAVMAGIFLAGGTSMASANGEPAIAQVSPLAMPLNWHATKLVVRNVAVEEQFYVAIGLKLLGRMLGGEGNVHQQESTLSTSGDTSTHLLILSQFVDLPPPATPPYPGEMWFGFTVPDVDAAVAKVEKAGGGVLRRGKDLPEHGVRAAVVTDPEGHIIEIVGPLVGH